MVAHEGKISNRRQQRGACRVYDLRLLEEHVLGLEADQPGARTARLRLRLTNLTKARGTFHWNIPAATEFCSLNYDIEVAEKRGATA